MLIHQLCIISAGLGLAAYWLAIVFGISAKSIPYLQEMMYAAIAMGLYINVLSIDPTLFKKCLGSIIKVVFIGVPIKIILPGYLLTFFSPKIAPIAYLCATVIAQIDPIASAQSLKHSKMSKKSETVLRAWSSFDDPITVLFAFYVFIPIIFVAKYNFGEYLVRLTIDVIVCFLVYYIYIIYNNQSFINNRVKRIIEVITIICILFYSILSGSFLLPAVIGLFIRPFESENLTKVTSAIFYFSVIIIGLLSANMHLDWLSGLILAISTFFLAQVLVTLLFLKDSIESKARVMFGHQNGMTAVILTVAIEVSGSDKTNNLLSVTLPAIMLIALFYFSTNYLLDRLVSSKS